MNAQLWIKELKERNPGAFEQLVESHQKKVINTCYRFLNNREDAEEIAQEVFIEIFKSIADFREEASLSTWIYRISVTRSLNFLKKMKQKKRFSLFQRNPGPEIEMEQIPAPSGSNPENELEERERRAILQHAVDSLPENQKTALILSKYDGFDRKEIAEIMGTTTSAVDSLVHRAKQNLQEKIHKYYKRHIA
jgi:RNA polymerase sigma-70 factor, ECF subfamily